MASETTVTRYPTSITPATTVSSNGLVVASTSQTGVTTTYGYDALGRQVSQTDGRGNTTRTVYDSLGRVTSTIDALGYATAYGYDALGRQVSVTDPLTNTVYTAYDTEGRVLSQRGATYPVDYSYDEFGNKTSMTTYRQESDVQPVGRDRRIAPLGDTTRWLYDEPTGLVTNKLYADGKGPSYSYTPDGKLARRTWARGVVTDYAYDNAGQLASTTYSDNTPTIIMAYDRVGNLINATTAGVVTNLYVYDIYGHCTNEWQNDFCLTRYYDTLGRNTGYAINGTRQTTIAYDSYGRISTMAVPAREEYDQHHCSPSTFTSFQWSYLQGSDLKESLTYPNGLTASWTYDANNQLLQVKNATPTNVISQFDYTYDAVGRRIQIAKGGTAFAFDDVVSYGYNARSELTNAIAAADANYRYSYQYDPIGNRETSAECGTNTTYSANELNQYTQIAAESEATFVPAFDDDGDQTLVKTATGIWRVTYNGENRPILWVRDSDNTTLTMSYDHMGRRREKNNQRFFYDGYLQVANFHSTTTTSDYNYFIWDPTEPVATRPLAWLRADSAAYYIHDGNKNVSEVVGTDNTIAAHYDYAPFGAVSAQRGTLVSANPWRFSSEYGDDELGCDYYNYREYEPVAGRWMSRDSLDEEVVLSLYVFGNNESLKTIDYLGELKIAGSGLFKHHWPTPVAGLFITLTFEFDGALYKSCCNGEEKEMMSLNGSVTIAVTAGKEFRGKVKAHNSKGSKCRDKKTGRYIACPDNGLGGGLSIEVLGTDNNSDVGLGECDSGWNGYVAIVGNMSGGLPWVGGYSGSVYWELLPQVLLPDASLGYDSSARGLEISLGVVGGLRAQFEIGQYVEIPLPSL